MRSANEVADLLEGMRIAKETEERSVRRYRVSAETIRKVSERVRLRPAFLEELEDALADRGWLLMPKGDHFGILEATAVDGWPRLGDSYLDQALRERSRDEEPVPTRRRRARVG